MLYGHCWNKCIDHVQRNNDARIQSISATSNYEKTSQCIMSSRPVHSHWSTTHLCGKDLMSIIWPREIHDMWELLASLFTLNCISTVESKCVVLSEYMISPKHHKRLHSSGLTCQFVDCLFNISHTFMVFVGQWIFYCLCQVKLTRGLFFCNIYIYIYISPHNLISVWETKNNCFSIATWLWRWLDD